MPDDSIAVPPLPLGASRLFDGSVLCVSCERVVDLSHDFAACNDRLVAGNAASEAGTGAVDVGAVRARCEAATPGPWQGDFCEIVDWNNAGSTFSMQWVSNMDRDEYPYERAAADAMFMALARTDVPALCDEVDRLRVQLAARDAELANMRMDLAEAVRVSGETDERLAESQRETRDVQSALDAVRSDFVSANAARERAEAEARELRERVGRP